MLAGAGLGDDAGLAHPLRKQRLAHGVVHLVSAGVIQILALQVHAGASNGLRPPVREVKRRRSAHIVPELRIELREELGIVRIALVRIAQLRHRPNQRLRDERTSVGTEMSVLVGITADDSIFRLDVRQVRHWPPPS